MEEGRIICMTSKEIRKKFPIDEEVLARTKALQDAGVEPYIDDDCPDFTELPDPPPSAFRKVLNLFLNALP